MSVGKSTLEKRKSRAGIFFILPWLSGLILFFSYPIYMTIRYSLSRLDRNTLEISFVGIENFRYAFQTDAEFPRLLFESTINTIKDVPMIIVFAFFAALLLRKSFFGNSIVKSIFFLTVILSSDVFIRMQIDTGTVSGAVMGSVMQEMDSVFTMLDSLSPDRFSLALGINPAWIEYINDGIRNIFMIMLRSGIQIFLFLAGLHSIPNSFYEACEIEGATAWETFWKITFPMMTPILIVNIVYTIIDSFSTYLNETLRYIYNSAFSRFEYGYSAALSIIYFIVTMVILAIVFFVSRKRVFYQGV